MALVNQPLGKLFGNSGAMGWAGASTAVYPGLRPLYRRTKRGHDLMENLPADSDEPKLPSALAQPGQNRRCK